MSFIADEWDEYDATATHYLLTCDGVPVACSRSRRIYYPDYEGKIDTHCMKLERFAVLEEYRGKNVGKELAIRVIREVHQANASQNYPYFIINAQQYVEEFYKKLGFETDTSIPLFYEAGIPHQQSSITNDNDNQSSYKDTRSCGRMLQPHNDLYQQL
eukprot:gene13233-15550_t